MGGLLQRVAGGALAGAGDAMVDQAKQAREDALLALKRSQAVDDRDAGFAQQDKTVGTQEQGATDRANAQNATSITTTGMNNDTQKADTASNNATSITTTGMNNATSQADTASTNATSRANNADTTSAQLKVATIRATAIDNKTAAIASQYGTGKVLTYNQALTTARQAYKDNASAFTEDDGTAMAPDKAIAGIAAKLMNNQPASGGPATTVATGGGMLSAFPQLSAPSSDSNAGPLSLSASGPAQSLTAPSAVTPPQAAVDMLKSNPKLSAQFDQKYGQGAAARVMGR